ncbi:GNAT family N-acetyltransferase [Sulfitobacter sp. W002]|uniref:GNAT family N-acetyltransferase n=1 Tax=Sulfitobacter sp. W002 TaxID=2867024 RepID=UPI0021A8A371|nr:GNAT family protein [Sulfitobacter sp. W002]
MQIRKLHAEDAAVFHALRLEGLHAHPEAFGASFEGEANLPLADVAKRLEAGCVFGGFSESGRLEGVVGLAQSQAPKTRHIATIWGMYVRPEARGGGLAQALMEAAMAEADGRCISIRLSVVSTNQAALRLYKRMGFTQWAVDTEALLVDGAYYDEVLMRRSRS